MKRSRILSCVIGLVAAVGLGGCAADEYSYDGGGASGSGQVAKSNKIVGSVSEWAVDVSAQSADEGDVIFSIANYGSIPHEFLVVKTDFEPGKIPLTSEDRFSEDGEGLEVVDEIAEWPVNTAGVLKLNLKPGNYQLLCNIAGHYKAGMYTPFVVEAAEKPVVLGPTGGDKVTTGDEPPSNDITGEVTEWGVAVSSHESAAGDVNFTIKNAGTIPHEFLVVKTDYEPGKIPLGENNRFDEKAEGLTVIDEIPEWEPGTTGKLTVKLEPGKYQLLCNIEAHYAAGMYTPLLVR